MDIGNQLASTSYSTKNLAYTKKCMRAGLHTALFNLRYNYGIAEVNPFIFPMRWLWENFSTSLIMGNDGKVNFNPLYFPAFVERVKLQGYRGVDVLSFLEPVFRYQYHCESIDDFIGPNYVQDKTVNLSPKKITRGRVLTYNPSDELVKTLFRSRALTTYDLSSNLWEFVSSKISKRKNIKRMSIPPIHGGLMKDVSWAKSLPMLEDILKGVVKSDGEYADLIEQVVETSYKTNSRENSFQRMMDEFSKSEFFAHTEIMDKHKGDLAYFDYSKMWFRDSTHLRVDNFQYMPGIPITYAFIDLYQPDSTTNTVDFFAALSGISGYVFNKNTIGTEWFKEYFGEGAQVRGCPMFSSDGQQWYTVEQVFSVYNPPGNLVWDDSVEGVWGLRTDLFNSFYKKNSTAGSEAVKAVRGTFLKEYDDGAQFSSLVKTPGFMLAIRRGLKVSDFDSAVKSLVPPSLASVVA